MTDTQSFSLPHVVPNRWFEPVEASLQSMVPLNVRVRSSQDICEKYFFVGGCERELNKKMEK